MKFMRFLLPLLFSTGMGNGAITFTISFSENAQMSYTPDEQQVFTDGLNFWGSVITGYRDGVSRTWRLEVDTFSEAAVNNGVRLGSASPSNLSYSDSVLGAGTSNGRFIISGGGSARFNTHPDAGALNPLTIRHEIGHALGIGTLWEDNQVYNDGVAGNSNRTLAGGVAGHYVGGAGLAAYRNEFDPAADFVPVELDGGDGTANGHWNERVDNIFEENQAGADDNPGDGAAAPTVRSGPNAGESLDDELMTGALTGSGYLSQTTIGSLYDIGFIVVPEPSVAFLAGCGLIFSLRRRRV